MNIAALSGELGVKLEITMARHPARGLLWRCHLHCVTTTRRSGHQHYYRTHYGWGESAEASLSDYVNRIRGKWVLIHPYGQCKAKKRRYRMPERLSVTA